jgi:hypothetical protein
LVVQHAFENLDEADTRDLVNEILQQFDRIIRDPWGSEFAIDTRISFTPLTSA